MISNKARECIFFIIFLCCFIAFFDAIAAEDQLNFPNPASCEPSLIKPKKKKSKPKKKPAGNLLPHDLTLYEKVYSEYRIIPKRDDYMPGFDLLARLLEMGNKKSTEITAAEAEYFSKLTGKKFSEGQILSEDRVVHMLIGAHKGLVFDYLKNDFPLFFLDINGGSNSMGDLKQVLFRILVIQIYTYAKKPELRLENHFSTIVNKKFYQHLSRYLLRGGVVTLSFEFQKLVRQFNKSYIEARMQSQSEPSRELVAQIFKEKTKRDLDLSRETRFGGDSLTAPLRYDLMEAISLFNRLSPQSERIDLDRDALDEPFAIDYEHGLSSLDSTFDNANSETTAEYLSTAMIRVLLDSQIEILTRKFDLWNSGMRTSSEHFEYTDKEIAAALGVSPTSSSNKISRAKNRLRKYFEDIGITNSEDFTRESSDLRQQRHRKTFEE